MIQSSNAPNPFDDDDAVRRLSRPPSAVARREGPWGFIAGLAGAIGLGVIVFVSLSAGRHAQAKPPPPPPPPRPIALAQNTQLAPMLVTPVPPPPPPTTDPAAAAEEQARLRAPSMVVDFSQPDPAPTQAAQGAPAPGRRATTATTDSNERFADQANNAQVETAHATRLSDTALVAPQGTVIYAVLETGIVSDLPGFARAIVSRDVSGFDGARVVIPRGSRLIGEYKSGVAQGQHRAFVIWTRLLTPDGVSVNLASPGTDRLGRGGLEGKTDTHFFQRFGAAILLSVIDGGVQVLANRTASSSGVNAVVIGSPQQAANVASIALQKDIDIPVTITVPQGQAIRVFVARDLDFSDVLGSR